MLTIDQKKLDKLTSDFCNVTGITMGVYDADLCPVGAFPKDHCSFCRKIRETELGEERCRKSDLLAFEACKREKRPYTYQCHMGLTESMSPICENGIIIGYILIGQMLDLSHREQVVQTVRRRYPADAAELLACLDEVLSFSPAQISSMAALAEICTRYLWIEQILNTKESVLAKQIQDYILEHLSEALSVKSICNYFYISRSMLYRCSSEYFDMGISDYIRLQRLERAKQLLVTEPGLTVREVGRLVGIEDANYFTRFFKKQTGVCPKQYSSRNE